MTDRRINEEDVTHDLDLVMQGYILLTCADKAYYISPKMNLKIEKTRRDVKMQKIITLISRNPAHYHVDAEAFSDLVASGQDDTCEKILQVISQVDEQFERTICCGYNQTPEDDTISMEIENFFFPFNKKLLISSTMISTKGFAIYMEFNRLKQEFGIEFNLSDPEAAKIEYRKRLDKVKGMREAITFEKPVRITA